MDNQASNSQKAKGMPFFVAKWHVDPSSMRISKDKRIVKLQPKAMAVLDYLACRPGTVISRKELEETVWEGRVVGYDALSNVIIKLRKALNDKAHKPYVIETIPKTGYRLIAGVSLEDQAEQAIESEQHRRWGTVSVVATVIVLTIGIVFWWQPWVAKIEMASLEGMAFPLPDKPSIAVLPFSNLSDDAQQEYFADGMTDDLITDISKVSGLFVIARNSVFSYKGKTVEIGQIAEELGVRYIMEGSVRRVGNQVRINAQLIDATTGGHVWAERYDGSLQDIFTLQDQITQKIVTALKVSLIEEETQQAFDTPDSVEAHDAFLQGWAYYKLGTRVGYASSIPHLKEAIRLDPGYAHAHAVLASAYWDALVNNWAFDIDMPSFRAEELAKEHLEAALKTPNPLAHVQQSRIYLTMGFPDEAVKEAEKAVTFYDNDATAHAALANALVLAGRPKEGYDAIRKAMRLDPHHPPNYLTILGAALFGLEQFEEAAKVFDRALKRNPENEKALIYLASSYGYLGRMRKAEDTIETTNDLRATFGLGSLSLEKESPGTFGPFFGEIDFPSFGPKQAQERLRAGLSKIPALTWQYLVAVHQVRGAGNTWFEIEGAIEIDLATAKSFYDRGVLFVDVGNEAEGHWKTGRVPGAVNLPWVEDNAAKKQFRETTFSEIVDKTDEVVLYWCTYDQSTCTPYIDAAKAVNWGYQKIYYFNGGAPAWKDAGYPIETDG
jgi:adenylate cyclase